MAPGEGAQTCASAQKVLVTRVKHNKHSRAVSGREVSRSAVSFNERHSCPQCPEMLGSEGETNHGANSRESRLRSIYRGAFKHVSIFIDFRERRESDRDIKTSMRETSTGCLLRAPTGIWPETPACALTRNLTVTS